MWYAFHFFFPFSLYITGVCMCVCVVCMYVEDIVLGLICNRKYDMIR